MTKTIPAGAPVIQWGTVVLELDDEAFAKGFQRGRQYYFEDIHDEEPQRAIRLTVDDLLSQIVACDPITRAYRLDAEGLAHPVEYLGVFLGYLSGPLHPETPQEAQARIEKTRQEVVILQHV